MFWVVEKICRKEEWFMVSASSEAEAVGVVADMVEPELHWWEKNRAWAIPTHRFTHEDLAILYPEEAALAASTGRPVKIPVWIEKPTYEAALAAGIVDRSAFHGVQGWHRWFVGHVIVTDEAGRRWECVGKKDGFMVRGGIEIHPLP